MLEKLISNLKGSDKEIWIATDISLYHDEKVATWACFIKAGDQEFKHSAQFKDIEKNPMLETRALANALKVTDMMFDIKGKHLIIYSDYNQLLYYKPYKYEPTPRKRWEDKYKLLQDYINPMLEEARSYEFRWVKGHTGRWLDGSEGHIMNRWCDNESKKLAKKLIKERLK